MTLATDHEFRSSDRPYTCRICGENIREHTLTDEVRAYLDRPAIHNYIFDGVTTAGLCVCGEVAMHPSHGQRPTEPTTVQCRFLGETECISETPCIGECKMPATEPAPPKVAERHVHRWGEVHIDSQLGPTYHCLDCSWSVDEQWHDGYEQRGFDEGVADATRK